MDENKIRQIVRDEVNRGTNKSRFELKSIPRHVHDGVDSLNISEDNVLLTKKLTTQLILSESETFTLRNVYNVSRISYHAIAYDSSSSPATKKATISGEIIFGKCSEFTGSGSSISTSGLPIVPNAGSGNTSAFLQSSNSIYINTGNLTHTSVTAAPYLVYAQDNSTIYAVLSLDSYKNDELTFTSYIATSWILNGVLIIE
ncbi:MAG: hypothetical protein IPP74_14515 [Alphaproteobacteria bacterium]|nr:hypothetical protein [Alphaproteobacteria bacterium]